MKWKGKHEQQQLLAVVEKTMQIPNVTEKLYSTRPKVREKQIQYKIREKPVV